MWDAKEYWVNISPKEVRQALSAGSIDVYAKDEDGRTSLMRAAKYNQNSEIITALINAGADIYAQTE